MSDDASFRLRIEHSAAKGQLTVSPELTGPAGAVVRYEMTSAKQGAAGKSNTRQDGRVTLDPGGAAKLSTLRLSLGPQDRYAIKVMVFDGNTMVAEQSLSYPP